MGNAMAANKAEKRLRIESTLFQYIMPHRITFMPHRIS